jgi:hypothetical protein
MQFNTVGLVAAASTFFGVWFGHVAVRKIEFTSPTLWLPAGLFAIAGIAFEWLSLSSLNLQLSAFSGIVGITLLWDALEFTRQQNRIRKGHAPANPHNPRHRRLMQEYSFATTLDLLKREPLGKPVSHAEAVKLITEP